MRLLLVVALVALVAANDAPAPGFRRAASAVEADENARPYFEP